MIVSDADGVLEEQLPDALKFIGENSDEIRRVVAAAGVDGVSLDFGLWFRDVAVQGESFPVELVALAGALGLELSLTLYPPPEPES